MVAQKIPGAVEMSEADTKKWMDRMAAGQKAREAKMYPPAGTATQKLARCRKGRCKGDVVKETKISYSNPEGRMGCPRPSPHYAHRAYCNGCAQSYEVDILEKLLAKSAH